MRITAVAGEGGFVTPPETDTRGTSPPATPLTISREPGFLTKPTRYLFQFLSLKYFCYTSECMVAKSWHKGHSLVTK